MGGDGRQSGRDNERVKRNAVPTIRESLRDGAGRIDTALSTWIYLGMVVWLLGGMLLTVSTHSLSSVVFPLVFVVATVATWAVLRYRPAVTESLGRFVIVMVATYLAIFTVVLPGWVFGSVPEQPGIGVTGAVLGWSGAVVVGYGVAYRDWAERVGSLLPARP